jgi:hypothetical protein
LDARRKARTARPGRDAVLRIPVRPGPRIPREPGPVRKSRARIRGNAAPGASEPEMTDTRVEGAARTRLPGLVAREPALGRAVPRG